MTALGADTVGAAGGAVAGVGAAGNPIAGAAAAGAAPAELAPAVRLSRIPHDVLIPFASVTLSSFVELNSFAFGMFCMVMVFLVYNNENKHRRLVFPIQIRSRLLFVYKYLNALDGAYERFMPAIALSLDGLLLADQAVPEAIIGVSFT